LFKSTNQKIALQKASPSQNRVTIKRKILHFMVGKIEGVSFVAYNKELYKTQK
jgi:hypothetical protein